MKLEEKLNYLIEKKRFVSEVAALTGVARSTIYRTLSGKTKPSYAFYEAVDSLYNEVVAEQQKAV